MLKNMRSYLRHYALQWFIILATTLIGSQVVLTQVQGQGNPTPTPSNSGGMPGMDMSSTPVPSGSLTQTSLTGYLVAAHGTPKNAGDPMGMATYLLDATGKATNLDMDYPTALKLNGQKVMVKGALRPKTKISSVEPDTLQVASIAAVTNPSQPQISALAAVTGSRPWVSVLCRFGDETTITPNPASYFDTLVSSTYPGINHFWQEMSYGTANINGSVTRGWYNLPFPRAHYNNSDGSFNLNAAAQDCTALAVNDVNFPSFTGINTIYNDSIGCCAWGGGSPTLTLNGQTKSYSMTWMPPWGFQKQQVLAHEMGHGFGLRHSSGPTNYPGYPYINWWDVMSTGGSDCTVRDATLGCLGTGTIAYHRDQLGWIPAARKFTASVGTSNATITLERLDLPVSTTDYLMAQIPIGGSSTHFYTVEARMKTGYDSALHGNAVIIHEVDTTRTEPAHVIDTNSDGNNNTGDSSAMWTPGKTFTDSANQITVAVIGNPSSTSYSVTISNGTAANTNTPVPTATSTSVPPTKTNTPLPSATFTPTFVPPTKVTTNTPIPTATSTSTGGNTLFSTGLESGQIQPSWTNTIETANGGLNNVGGICCGLTGPELGTRSEIAHTGSVALMYSGKDNSASSSFAYLKVFDLSGKNITITSTTKLSYWIYPQSSATSGLVSGANSSCVAIDMVFTDGSNLRDSGVVDQKGNRLHPAMQCGHLTMDSWNNVTANLGGLSGKTISRIIVAYDQPANTGGYRGYVDDIAISIP